MSGIQEIQAEIVEDFDYFFPKCIRISQEILFSKRAYPNILTVNYKTGRRIHL